MFFFFHLFLIVSILRLRIQGPVAQFVWREKGTCLLLYKETPIYRMWNMQGSDVLIIAVLSFFRSFIRSQRRSLISLLLPHHLRMRKALLRAAAETIKETPGLQHQVDLWKKQKAQTLNHLARKKVIMVTIFTYSTYSYGWICQSFWKLFRIKLAKSVCVLIYWGKQIPSRSCSVFVKAIGLLPTCNYVKLPGGGRVIFLLCIF